MMKPVLDIKLFRKDNGECPVWERRRSQKALLWALESLCRINQDIFRVQKTRHKPVPALYGSGMAYQREDGAEWWKEGTKLEGRPTELWQDVYTTVERKGGDCEDLAAYRVAELREVYHRRARPYLTFRYDGTYHYHALVIVEGPGGRRIEDPSRKMGMGFEEYYGKLPQKERDRIIKLIDGVQKKASPPILAKFKNVQPTTGLK